MVKSIDEIKQCPACGSDNLVYAKSQEQIICRDCGLVHEPFSSLAKEVLAITQPAESAPLVIEKVSVKPPKAAKAKPSRRKLTKPTKPKARKTAPKAKKAVAKKSQVRKIKTKPRQKPRPAVKLAIKKVQMPVIPQPHPAKLGFRARLKRLVRGR